MNTIAVINLIKLIKMHSSYCLQTKVCIKSFEHKPSKCLLNEYIDKGILKSLVT